MMQVRATALATANKRVFFALAAIPLAGLCVLLYAVNPAGTFPVCPFYALTGKFCPGCGSLRATHQLMRGNLMGALDYNVLLVLSLPILLYSLASAASVVIQGRSLPRWFISSRTIWALLVVIVAFWIARNIPTYPLSWLAPGA